MAEEITALESRVEGNGHLHILLFKFPISATPVDGIQGPTPVQVNGVTVVPTPAAGLPPFVTDAQFGPIVSVLEQADFDSGAAAFAIKRFHAPTDLTNAQLAARVRTMYDAALAEFIAEYELTYRFAGSRINR